MPFTQLPDVNILHNLGTFIRTKKGNIRAILLTADFVLSFTVFPSNVLFVLQDPSEILSCTYTDIFSYF